VMITDIVCLTKFIIKSLSQHLNNPYFCQSYYILFCYYYYACWCCLYWNWPRCC